MEGRQVFLACPTEDQQKMSHQPVEDMDMEVDTSYEDTLNGSKYSVSETVEIGVVDHNQIVISDMPPKQGAVFGEEVNTDTKLHIEHLIKNNADQLHASSPKPSISSEDLEEFEADRKELDELVRQDPDRIPVKKMRKVVPKMRMHCYMSEDDIKAKRKHKHLWDEKPHDWPVNVPFKDPNNKSKNDTKPGKEVLTQMFLYLRDRYIMNNQQSSFYQPEEKEVRQLHHPSEEVEVVAPQEESVMETMTPVQVEQTPTLPVADPVSGLYKRIEEKITQVEHLVADNQECREALQQVFQDIIKALYIQSKAITMCGWFLDAGHDLENLLDKGLAFGQLLDATVIKRGCQMIIAKYQNTQRSVNNNIKNVSTPIYRCTDATPAAMMKNRFVRQRKDSVGFPQTVSDGCDVVIKQEPMSPGKPFSPTSQMTKDMEDVQIKEEVNLDYNNQSFGIQTKGNSVDLISGLIDVRTPKDAIQEIHDLTKDVDCSLPKPTTTATTDLEFDLLKMMKDIQESEEQSAVTDDFDEAHQQMAFLQNLMAGTGNDVNLNTAIDQNCGGDIFDDVLGLEETYCGVPNYVTNANDVTASVARPANTEAPPPAVSGASFNTLSCSPELPTMVENFGDYQKQCQATPNGGGKVPTQRRRSVKQDRAGKVRGKYNHI